MFKVKQLYSGISDGDGNTWLIKKEDYDQFDAVLVNIENKFCHEEGYDEDDFWIDFENLLEQYQAKHIESEQVCIVVLPEDIIEGEE